MGSRGHSRPCCQSVGYATSSKSGTWVSITFISFLPSFLSSVTGSIVHASDICKQDKLAGMVPARSKALHPCLTPGPNHASHWLLPLYLFC